MPNAAFTVCTGINIHGQIIGTYEDSKGIDHGFLLSQGVYTTLDFSKKRETHPWGINDRGQIVGDSSIRGSSATFGDPLGFLWDHGVYTTLKAPDALELMTYWGINNRGQIIGGYIDRKRSKRWREAGVIAFEAVMTAFVLDHGVYRRIAPPKVAAGADITLKGINDEGLIVGEYQGAGNRSRGFLLHYKSGFRHIPSHAGR